MKRTLLILTALATFSSTASAQQAPPTCADAPYRDFDFWIGEWDVYSVTDEGASDAPVGTNTITSEENGCLLVENWVNSGGVTGQSYNFYDPSTDRWRQLWVSPGVIIDYMGGLREDGAMALTGTITYRTGRVTDFKGTWTPKEDGTVLQEFTEYNENDDIWADWFTGLYVPAGSPPP